MRFSRRGSDEMDGGRGSDYLDGNGGHDWMQGKGGKDTLIGGGGRDELTGGKGADELTGGLGADLFIFEPGHGRDTITDFQQGRDKIGLQGVVTGSDDLSLAQIGDDVLIRGGNVRVIVQDDEVDNFTGADFLL